MTARSAEGKAKSKRYNRVLIQADGFAAYDSDLRLVGPTYCQAVGHLTHLAQQALTAPSSALHCARLKLLGRSPARIFGRRLTCTAVHRDGGRLQRHIITYAMAINQLMQPFPAEERRECERDRGCGRVRPTRSIGSTMTGPWAVHTGGGGGAALLQNMKERREVECAWTSMNRSTLGGRELRR